MTQRLKKGEGFYLNRGQQLELLSQADFFSGLDDEALGEVLDASHRRKVERTEVLFHQGDPAVALYMVESGRVKLTQLTSDGQQVLMNFVERAELCGGVAVLAEAAYPVTAEAAETSLLLAWDGRSMQALMERMPRIAINILRHLAARVHFLHDRVRELATERVEQRIARALVRLASQAGMRTEAGIQLGMSLTRQDLAELTGTTLYTVSRHMSRWEAEGIVESGRERVVIVNPHALMAIADDLPDRPR